MRDEATLRRGHSTPSGGFMATRCAGARLAPDARGVRRPCGAGRDRLRRLTSRVRERFLVRDRRRHRALCERHALALRVPPARGRPGVVTRARLQRGSAGSIPERSRRTCSVELHAAGFNAWAQRFPEREERMTTVAATSVDRTRTLRTLGARAPRCSCSATAGRTSSCASTSESVSRALVRHAVRALAPYYRDVARGPRRDAELSRPADLSEARPHGAVRSQVVTDPPAAAGRVSSRFLAHADAGPLPSGRVP
jgi:hypothetical protein